MADEKAEKAKAKKIRTGIIIAAVVIVLIVVIVVVVVSNKNNNSVLNNSINNSINNNGPAPCVVDGVTVPAPWYQDPDNAGQCLAPAGQQCCNAHIIDGQPACQAGFAGYDAAQINNWIGQCI